MKEIIISVVLFLFGILFTNIKFNRLNEELKNNINPLPTIGTSENSNNDVLVDKLNKLDQESKKIKEELNKFKNRGGSSGDGDITNTFNITGGHTTQSLNELGYEITSDNKIIFNKEVEFKKHANFRSLVDFYHHTKMHYNKHHNLLPKGTIILNYASNNIPYGWALCDGKSYKLNSLGKAEESTAPDAIKTPNLNGIFVKGCTNCSRTGGWANHKFERKNEKPQIKISENQLPAHWHTYKVFPMYEDQKTKVDLWWKGEGDHGKMAYTKTTHEDTWGTLDWDNDRHKGDPIDIPEPPHIELVYIMKL